MDAKRRICAVTGSRADYGLLHWVLKEIQGHTDLSLLTAVTGMHLSPEFGLTYREIEKDGFAVDAKVEMLLSGDTPESTAKSVGLGVIGFADAFSRMSPDFVLVLGDRFEIFAASQAAYLAGIPIAHIAGGDTTEGAFDEGLRHSITKMAHLHFVTNEAAARRVRQMGEHPARIHNFGSPGIDAIRHLERLPRSELERQIGFRLLQRNILVTFHPATLEAVPAAAQFAELLGALDALGPAVGILLTLPNADTGGRALLGMIDEFVRAHPNARAYASLGSHLYLNAMTQVDAVVGNSSSALYEAPSLRVPAVNIGDRQKGRPQASSVINCSPAAPEILRAIHAAFQTDCSDTVNPYGDGSSAPRIVATLASIGDPKSLLRKEFVDLGGPS
ncbi:MAG TPA: UDP-N-acetylglucosamine 2-epimerase [Burkholderiales bacterium]|nr:UDP-N-acetylglucosamine 2-epimerase [Burkholderiales bacterium]